MRISTAKNNIIWYFLCQNIIHIYIFITYCILEEKTTSYMSYRTEKLYYINVPHIYTGILLYIPISNAQGMKMNDNKTQQPQQNKMEQAYNIISFFPQNI